MSDSPLGRGKGRQALGWVIARGQRNPPRRSATAVAPRHPSEGGDFQESFSYCLGGARSDENSVPLGWIIRSGSLNRSRQPLKASPSFPLW